MGTLRKVMGVVGIATALTLSLGSVAFATNNLPAASRGTPAASTVDTMVYLAPGATKTIYIPASPLECKAMKEPAGCRDMVILHRPGGGQSTAKTVAEESVTRSSKASSASVSSLQAIGEYCGASCLVWNQNLYATFFYNGWGAWHNKYGWGGSVDCEKNGGAGFTVVVNSCGWAGSNPAVYSGGEYTEPYVHFHVDALYKGFPVSAYFWLALHCYGDGYFSVQTGR
jgi:hypothetical protein